MRFNSDFCCCCDASLMTEKFVKVAIQFFYSVELQAKLQLSLVTRPRYTGFYIIASNVSCDADVTARLASEKIHRSRVI